MGELANLFDEIFQNFNDFDCNIMHGKEYKIKLKDTYVSFNNYLIKWSKQLINNVRILEDKFSPFFK